MMTTLLLSLLTPLLQLPAPPSEDSLIKYAWYAIAVLLLAGVALIVLMSKQREEVQTTNEKRANSAESLVKTRDTELVDSNKRDTKCQEDLEDMKSEYKALAGINVKELFDFWASKNEIETDLAVARSEIRRKDALIAKLEAR